MISISKPKLINLLVLGLLIGLTIIPFAHAFTYSGTNLPSNTIYFDDFSNYVTPSPCITSALVCLPGWGAYDNATGGIANITTWHPLASSGKSMLMGSSTTIGGKFDRHRSWAIMPGQTRVSISQWFQFSQNALQGINQNEIHFSIEMADGINFHECVEEFFTLQIGANQYISINDGVFNYNMSLNAWDRGGFNGGALNTIWDNNQWHYEKITMDISNPTAPTCPYMQMDSIIFSNLNNNQGWRTTFGNKVNYQGTASIATTHGLGGTYTGQIASLPWRLEIATISAVGNPQYYTWHTNILITDDSTIPTQSFFAANELWKAVAAMGSMMSVMTMYSSVRAYQEPDPLRRRMKLMVAVVFAVGAGTLAVFAIILSRL